MPERRFEYVAEIEAAGLTPPDATTLDLLWKIVDEGVLGASRHVALGNELILHLIRSGPDDSEGLRRARTAAEFIARTRGRDTPIIANTMNRILAGLDDIPPDRQRDVLSERVQSWERSGKLRKLRLVEMAVTHLSGAASVMTFDYSSTVSAIAIALAEKDPSVLFVVPESRTISGGLRYLEEFVAAGLSIDFIPDAAIDHALETCDVALLGVETLMADGSFINTIGSRMIARLAPMSGVAVYGCTDLMKLDVRSYRGKGPAVAKRSYDEVLLCGEASFARGRVNTGAPELELVPAQLVTAILTEHGPLPPGAVWELGRSCFGLEEEAS